jgi:hypothetical protein
MKKVMILITVIPISCVLLMLMLCGCEAGVTERTDYPLPPGLSDCKIYTLENGKGGFITVMRCPNSVTALSKQEGKVNKNTIVVDGETYVRK